eukprot:GILI01001134.1.p1 GENE.GILI01001134.1~~GILI01001134.1.p1  ORF type:complete len:329 (+),score=78.02 GILI01001134.1:103-987(+)
MTQFRHISPSAQDLADERAYAFTAELQERDVNHMTEIFNAIDKNKKGHITKEEFRQYVLKNPKGWPLVDLFRAKAMNANERDVLVNFWFRKLDMDGSGHVNYGEFITIFKALQSTKVQETLYTDFLINLFDENLDGKIDRDEFTRMMHVLFGEMPPQQVLDSMPEGGFDRESLTRAMHSISMDYQLLPQPSGMMSLAPTESRIWNMESGVFEQGAITTPNSASVPATLTPSATASATAARTDSTVAKEARKQRNKDRKEKEDEASMMLAVVVTAAITVGVCVFVGFYGRKLGKF